MRLIVHYHAYGDSSDVRDLVDQHSKRIEHTITQAEEVEVGRLIAEYEPSADRLTEVKRELDAANAEAKTGTSAVKRRAASRVTKLEKERAKLSLRLADRDTAIAEARQQAAEDRADVAAVGAELVALYDDPTELLKHVRLVGADEIADNEFNLNVPRYVDTFEPKPLMPVAEAREALVRSEAIAEEATAEVNELLVRVGYAD
jgi:type I restriction enzyme M protein